MKRPDAICVADRFPALRAHLLELLSGLSDEDWNRSTAAPLWSVKDVVAHLLGGDIGNLSRRRDQFSPFGGPIEGHENLVSFINELNAEWVRAARRISPRMLCELLGFTGPLMEAYFASLDPFAIGEPVSWAGPAPAPVWLDVAREFTERWHHQQQIRDATGRPPLYSPYFFAPVLDTFVRALPHGFRHTTAVEGTAIKLEITGDSGGRWFLKRGSDGWKLFGDLETAPAAEVSLPQDLAWRLFTKGMGRDEARRVANVSGDSNLAAAIFSTIAVIG
jgi:uncharacterized protein (TIGR03083 family)